MTHGIDGVLLTAGDEVTFKDRDDLLEKLDRLDQRVPSRHEGRTKEHREHYCMVRYLQLLAGEGGELLPLPVTLRKCEEDPPDFLLEWKKDHSETFELTDGSTECQQKAMSAASRAEDPFTLPVEIDTPHKQAAERWAEILFAAFLKKAEGLVKGRFNLDHLLIYDLTALDLLLPLERGAPILKRKLQEWQANIHPAYRFRRVSVLRDLALLLDAADSARILRRESSRFHLPVIRARDEEDLKRRLREIDRYCRENSIRYLKAFGSILRDRVSDALKDGDEDPKAFREESDLDLLVEFEPQARVTLLDMARMERELSELTEFKVDLRTAADLSRYFRHGVLQEAVELHAPDK